ncbi:MAG: iron ABC transporter permease [Alphaproteobacteria bacterium]|nr:iron ABC transporter permease [Alphaproteobacteria bacterium]
MTQSVDAIERMRFRHVARSGRVGPALLVWGLLAVTAYLVVPPVLILIYGSVTDTPPGAAPHFTWDTLAYAYSTPAHYRSLVNSLLYAAMTASIVLVIASFLAWLVERTNSSIRRMTDLFTLAPVLMPALLLVSGWILLLGPRNGLINMMAMEYLGLKSPVFNLFTFAGMVWVGALQELPLAFMWIWPAFRMMNPDLEEAARVAGAPPLTVLRRVTLPLLRPALLGAWIIFFIQSLGALSVPLLIGLPAGIYFYSTELYMAVHRVPSDLNLASAYSLLFLLVTTVGIFVYRRATVDQARFATIAGKGFNPRRINLGWWQLPATALGVVILLLTAGLPMFVIVWNAFMPFPQVPSVKSLQLLTLQNFPAAVSYGPAMRSLGNSLVLGLAAGLATTLLGAAIAWCVLRLRARGLSVALLDQLATAPVAIPGMIVGVSLLWFYLTVPVPIFGTLWILLIAYVTIHLPYATRICISGLSQLHIELEEAGSVAGAGRLVVFQRIVALLIAPSLVGSALYVGLRAFREYAASIFLAGPGTEVVAVLVLDMWDGGNANILSAYITMIMAALALMAAGFYWFGRRTGGRLDGKH